MTATDDISIMEKICCTCHESKPLDSYSKMSKAKDGLQARCKTCVKSWYKANKVAHRHNVNERQRMKKPEKVCPDCSETFRGVYLVCGSCRYKRKQKPCPSCERPMSSKSQTCNSCCDRSGQANGNWKGLPYKHDKGYVMIKTPDRGYVMEHRLVLEKELGRHLFKDENVHHLNGIRCDNRLENLELWVKPQPSGIRVQDAVAWATEILDRYADFIE